MFLLLACLLYGGMLQRTLVLTSAICAAPLPCTCSVTNVHCSSKSLNNVPIFQKTPTNYTAVYLANNHITLLGAGVFSNLSSASTLYLYLENNQINYIADGAFTGLEDTVLNLRLGKNNLTTLPKALTRLKKLTGLQMDGIHSIDPFSMIVIGLTLESLDIGMDGLINWPEELKYLLKLQSLTIRGMHFAHFPEAALENYQNTLWNLKIIDSILNHSPDAICNLHRLTSLELYDLDISSDELIPTCSKPLETVTFIDIRNNNLQPFPNVLSTFPKLANINIRTPLEYIDDRIIPDHNVVTYLTIQESQLRAVPEAIKQFKFARMLNLNDNNIVSIGEHDFSDLPSLQTLQLIGNPIAFVSELAFGNTSNIQNLLFQSTHLTTIPKAVLHLPHLTEFYLQGTPIECTCHMEWLLTWERLAHVNIHGNCYLSRETIADFLETKLKLCHPSVIG